MADNYRPPESLVEFRSTEDTSTGRRIHTPHVNVNTAGAASVVTVTPTVTAGAYSANDVVGGLQTIAGAVRAAGGSALLQSLFIRDKGNQGAQLTIYFFNADPADSTVADNGALVIHADDWAKLVGVVSIAAADYVTVGSRKYVHATPGTHPALGTIMKAAGTSLYAVATTTGTPTYAAVSDLDFVYGLLPID